MPIGPCVVVVDSGPHQRDAAALAEALRERGFQVLGAYRSHEDAATALAALVAKPAEAPAVRRSRRLSAREREVLALLATGHAYADIAGALGVRLSTIQSHVRNIYRKLEVTTKAEAAVIGVRLGLVG